MESYQRPCWALAIQMPVLDTTLEEDHSADEKRFVIEGKPVLKSLAWITYGPALALVVVIIMGLLAWQIEARSQPTPIKILIVCAMILLPGFFWAIGGSIINRLVQKHLERQIQAGEERVELMLNLSAKTLQRNQDSPIPFHQITDFKLVSDAGVYFQPQQEGRSLVNLVMETSQGQITLLRKDLGTLQQKLQLASQLGAIIKDDM